MRSDVMNFNELIKPELLALIPVLYFVGIGLKKSKLPDKWIPTALGIVSIVLSAFWVIATVEISGIQEIVSAIFTSATQGILVAGASVYMNQLYVQAKKDE